MVSLHRNGVSSWKWRSKERCRWNRVSAPSFAYGFLSSSAFLLDPSLFIKASLFSKALQPAALHRNGGSSWKWRFKRTMSLKPSLASSFADGFSSSSVFYGTDFCSLKRVCSSKRFNRRLFIEMVSLRRNGVQKNDVAETELARRVLLMVSHPVRLFYWIRVCFSKRVYSPKRCNRRLFLEAASARRVLLMFFCELRFFLCNWFLFSKVSFVHQSASTGGYFWKWRVERTM